MTRLGKRGMLSRRRFLEVSSAAGAGLLIGIYLPGCRSSEPSLTPGDGPGEINAWIRIGTDNTVTLIVAEAEMGQGILTSLPMILAEELEVDWSTVRSEYAPADPDRYGVQGTGGSWSIRGSYATMRRAGATAREMLVTAAAESWGVPVAECGAEGGHVLHPASSRRVSYGDVAERAVTVPPPTNPRLKDSTEFQLIGTPVKRLDSPPKVDGSAGFGLDVRIPNLLVAQVVHPPVFDGEVVGFDAARTLEVPGVRDVVEIPDGVAVIAEDFWSAKRGRDVLQVEWAGGEWADLSSERVTELCREIIDQGAEARDDGNAERAFDRSGTRIEAVYEAPYLAHAPMEPMNCTADVRPDRCEIWVGTQGQTSSQRLASRITGLPLDRVQVHNQFLGGGFGRRSRTDFVADAVHVSKAVDNPIKVIWTREDDMKAGVYRPVSYNELSGALDDDGWPVAWIHRIASPGIQMQSGSRSDYDPTSTEGASNLPYAIPNIRVTCAHPELPVPIHWWRSVGHSQNAWIVESFLDELANAGGKDPVALRQRLLAGHPRHQRLLSILAERADWGGPVPEGRARGVAIHRCFGTLVGQVAEVSLDASSSVRVHRVVCAVDCGQAVNPDTIAAQMESGIAFGLSAALWGEITLENGGTVQSNFHDYRVLRMSEMPQVETHVVPSGDAHGGIGETGLPPIAPAVCNAILALTGQPIRRLPIGNVP